MVPIPKVSFSMAGIKSKLIEVIDFIGTDNSVAFSCLYHIQEYISSLDLI